MESIRPRCRVRTYSLISVSKRRMSLTGTESIIPLVTAKMARTCSSTGTGGELGLLEHLDHPAAPLQLRLAGGVELRTELGECLQLAELGEVDPEGPATRRIARIWAEPPTRDTEVPALMAGRTPE